jgi:hypothetical protein
MLVFVLNKHGDPLMPCKAGKARMLLKEGKAKVVRRIGIECFIFGRRTRGYFALGTLPNQLICGDVNFKELRLLDKAKTLLTELHFPLQLSLETIAGVPSGRN